MLTCEQVTDAEYALGILSDVEEAAIREHLRTCREHPQLIEMRAVAMAMTSVAEEREPPAHLRDRVLLSAASRAPGRRSHLSSMRWLLPSIAAALAVVALAVWATTLRDEGRVDPFVKAFRSESGIDVKLVADFSRPSSELTFASLSPLSEGEEYSLWAIRDGAWLKVGAFRPNDQGRWSGKFPFQLQAGDSLCLTRGAPTDNWSQRKDPPLFVERLS